VLTILISSLCVQTRGNQRDVDRQRAAKRNEKGAKEAKRAAEGLTPLQRKER